MRPKWGMSPKHPLGSHVDIHVWHADLDSAAATLDPLLATLSPDERDRADRFVFERDQRRFIAARGLLRRLLGIRLGAEPDSLQFEYGERGKPFLAARMGQSDVSFNVAHSQGHAVFGLTSGASLGVDVEVVRQLHDAPAMAERFFSLKERDQLRALPPSQREVAFFLCWTRKEAYIKALGAGLAYPLEHFSVSVVAGEPQLLEDHTAAAQTAWSLHDLSHLPEYAAALAVRADPDRVTIHRAELDLD